MPSARSAATSASPRRARQINPAPVPRPRRIVSVRSMARVRWDRVGRIGLLIVLGVVGWLYVQHAVSFFSTRAQADRQEAIVRSLMASNARLTRIQRSLSQPATIAADARELGMVRPGEHPYVLVASPHH